MKTIKIFTVSFVILCLASLGVTITLTFVRENEKVRRLAAEQQSRVLEAENAGLNSRVEALSEERESISKQLAVQTKTVEELRAQAAQAEQQKQKLRQDAENYKELLEKIQKEYSDYKKKSAQVVETYKKKLEKLTGTGNIVYRNKQDGKKTGDGTISEAEGVELAPVVVTSDQAFAGKVMVVNRKFNFIITNIGNKDGLQLGHTLYVYRKGKRIATVHVEKLYESLSACGIVQEDKDKSIQEGDIVGN